MLHISIAMCVFFQLQNINNKIAFIERRKTRKFDFVEFCYESK